MALSRTRYGARSRLIYAIREYTGRKDQPKGVGRRGLRDLPARARAQLGGPMVLVWDDVRPHLTAGMREFIAGNAHWLTVFPLPSYAPDLNPGGGRVSGRSWNGRSAISSPPTSGGSPGP